MFQLDDKFLDEVGLGSLPDEQKSAFLEYFREQLETRVGDRLSNGLSDEQLSEFESFMDRDEAKVEAWLNSNVAGYQSDEVWLNMKAQADRIAQEGGTPLPDIAVKAEYASLRWLGINRPNYRDIVATVMNELRDETIKNRDAILGNSAT